MRVPLDLRHLWWRARGLRGRLTLWYLGILLTVLVLFATVVYLGLARSLRAELDHALALAAGQVLAFSDDGLPRLITAALPSGYTVSLYAPDGRLIDAGRGERLPLDPEVASAVTRGREVWRSIPIDDDSWRVLARPVVWNGRLVAVLQLGRSEDVVEDALEQLGLLLTALVPFALLLAGAGGMFLAGRALDPIDRITRTAATIGAEDLSHRLPHGAAETPDEVGRLAATFNHMLERLESAFRRQRQFTADASHELRTPLTLLRNQLDVALALPRSTEEYQRVLHGLLEDTVRLQRLLDALLALARADANQQVLVRERVDLGELAEQVVEAMRPLADEGGVRLTAQAEPDVAVLGDQAHLMQLLLNLVENALKHTPRGGSVTVETTSESAGGTARLVVRDTGSGIAPEHLPYLFERFYRADPARSAGGAGLGLAISRWIVEAHGGWIEAASRPGEGSTFTIQLPRVTPLVTPG